MRWWHDVSACCMCVCVCGRGERLLKWKRGKERKKSPLLRLQDTQVLWTPNDKKLLFNKEKVASYRLSFVAELSLTARAGKTNLRYPTTLDYQL